MARVTAKLSIQAQQTEDSTESHCPPGYTKDPYSGRCIPLMWGEPTPMSGGGGGSGGANPASHPPYWITKEWNIDSPFSQGSNFKEVLDNSDAFIGIVAFGSTISGTEGGRGARLRDAKLILLRNCGPVGIELLLVGSEYGATDEAYDNAMHTSLILGSGEFMVLPNQRLVHYSTATSAANASSLDNQSISTLYLDSTAKTTEAFSGDSDTNIVIDDASGGAANHFFRVGDIIRIENEILEITAINDDDEDGAYTPTSLTVRRGLFGSTKANHNNNDEVRFALFNEYADFDKFSLAQTDSSGKYKSSNLILNAGQRVSTALSRNFVRGSVALKFYNKGYQELGLAGVTSTTSTGLTASTAYQFNIAADGGTAVSISFTTDASNVNFGGANGVISKINDALNTQFNTFGGHLFEKEIICALVGGDVRFTSSTKTSASAIALADSSGSDTDVWGVGRFPAVANVEAAVAGALPEDNLYDKNYLAHPNAVAFAYDDGKGNFKGAATGTINYETGAIDIQGPINAEFVVSANYGSVHSGGINETASSQNGLAQIRARSCNSKINGEVEVIGFM